MPGGLAGYHSTQDFAGCLADARSSKDLRHHAAGGCGNGRSGGRLLVVNLHPWLMDQPYRSSYLAELLATLRLRDDVWFTTTDQIAAHAAPLQVTPA